MIIVSLDVIDSLCRLERPASLLSALQLPVGHGSYKPALQHRRGISVATDIADIVGVEGAALDGVADVVVEKTDSAELIAVPFICEPVRRHGGLPACPALAVHQQRRVELVELVSDHIHRLDIVQTHKVEAEAVQLVLRCKIFEGVYHKSAVHKVLRSGLVAAAGAVGEAAVLVHPMVIVREALMERRLFREIGVVVNDIHNNSDAVLMQLHDQLLELSYAALGIKGIGGIGTLKAVVIEGVVAPVVLRLEGLALVHSGVIADGQQLNVRNSQLLQMAEAGGNAAVARPFFGKRLKASPLRKLDARGLVYREIPDMTLIHHRVAWRLTDGSSHLVPALGVQLRWVNEIPSLAVYPAGAGIDVDGLDAGAVIEFKGIGIENVLGAVHQLDGPDAPLRFFHGNGLDKVRTLTVEIEVQINARRQRRPCLENGLPAAV